jgi:hypothetical protein
MGMLTHPPPHHLTAGLLPLLPPPLLQQVQRTAGNGTAQVSTCWLLPHSPLILPHRLSFHRGAQLGVGCWHAASEGCAPWGLVLATCPVASKAVRLRLPDGGAGPEGSPLTVGAPGAAVNQPVMGVSMLLLRGRTQQLLLVYL